MKNEVEINRRKVYLEKLDYQKDEDKDIYFSNERNIVLTYQYLAVPEDSPDFDKVVGARHKEPTVLSDPLLDMESEYRLISKYLS